MANEDPAAPWTIEAVPVAVREKAVRYARMEGVTMAEWLSRAVETQAQMQEANQVLLPGKPGGVPRPPPQSNYLMQPRLCRRWLLRRRPGCR